MSVTNLFEDPKTTSNNTPSSNFNAPYVEVSALIETAQTADKKFREFESLIGSLETGFANRKAEIEERWNSVTSLSKSQRGSLAAKEIDKARHEAASNSEGIRWNAIRDLNRAAETAQNAATHYESPSALLAREGLGSESRSRYLDQMQYSGPAELRNFAQVASSKSSRTMGAAVLSRLDAMDANTRKLTGISRQEFSRNLCGNEFDRAQQSIKVIRNRAQSAINRNRAFETGKSGGTAILEALNAQQEGNILQNDNTVT